ncbi:MAG TPA: hypothetical protein VGB55_05665, partial [Tepidisphaeraceae bacterium]
MRKKSSWSRMILLVAMMAAVAYLASSGYAQEAGTPAAAAEENAPGSISLLLDLVLRNIDFVFIIILLLSMVAMTLIISSILRLRKNAFMPDASIEQMR